MPARCANPVAIQGRSGRLYPEGSLLQFGVFVVAEIDCRCHPEGRSVPLRISPDFWRVRTERVCFPCIPGRARGPGANAPSIKSGAALGIFPLLYLRSHAVSGARPEAFFLLRQQGFVAAAFRRAVLSYPNSDIAAVEPYRCHPEGRLLPRRISPSFLDCSSCCSSALFQREMQGRWKRWETVSKRHNKRCHSFEQIPSFEQCVP
jgi:hypothetical protein